MSVISVGILQTQTINQSGTDSINFVGAGTLDVTGIAGTPITVDLSQVAGAGVLDTINISNAVVTLGGVAGVSALTQYNITADSELVLSSSVSLAAGSAIEFVAAGSRLVFGSGVDFSLIGSITGFGYGSSIDVAPAAASLLYAANPGMNTGGVITLLNSGGQAVDTVTLNTGSFTSSSFMLSHDSSGGTIIGFYGVTLVTASPMTADLDAGKTVTFNVGTNDNVTVAGGTPTLSLSDGGTATYDAAASTPTNLVFAYTVAAGQNAADLSITGYALNGATVTDSIGNPFDLSPAVVNPPGILQIDTTAPTIAGVTTSPGSGDLGVGQSVTFTVVTSKAVTVSGGTPTLTLSDGGTATYAPAASTSTALAFTYTVASGQNAADLSVTGAALNGATIADAAGNAADLSGAVVNPPGILQIDTTAPTIAGVTTSPGSGDLGVGQSVTFTVATSKAVTVSGGTPTLTLSDGGTATYAPAASTSTALAFTYTVASGQNAADLSVTGAALNGATIADAAGNAADLSGAVVNPPGILQIDTTAPTIAGVTTSPGSGDLGVGQSVTFTVATSKAVTVSGGTPTLTLSDGGTATYAPAASTSTALAFTYTVASGQNAADLSVTGWALNGATIADAAGNAADLSGAVVNPPGILQIDTTAPTIAGVTTSPGSGDLGVGQSVTFTVATSKAVTVSGGTPTLTLSDGGTATYAPAASTSTALAFTYTVASGQNAADLSVTGSALNGATIADAAGNAADLSGAVVNPPGILQIDTTAPTIAGVTTSPGSGDLGVGQSVTFTVATSKAVTVSGGTPTLTLSDGGTATYAPAASTSTALAFTYTVASGQNAADLSVTGSALNGATIADAAGNAADLSGAVVNPPGILQIDTTAPTIAGVTTSPGSGDLGVGQSVTFTVATSKAVTVSGGTPTLTLSDGGTATYAPAASTSTALAFTYTVASGQNAADLSVTGSALNGATIADAAGNAADLGPVLSTPVDPVQIDGIAPTVTAVTTSPSPGDIDAGQQITFTIGSSKPVSVIGTPTLDLNNGGIASYDVAASSPSSLVFDYTLPSGSPVPGKETGDLSITGALLNGGTIKDSAGNPLAINAAAGDPPAVRNFAILNTNSNDAFYTAGDAYTGPVQGLQHQYINITPDNLDITALVPNSFIHSGSGEDAIDVSGVGGTNVLDGSTGSNFLVGGSGNDTFFIDDRGATAQTWSTVSNFHTNDAVTLYGITPADFSFTWTDNQGAVGYTGLTLRALPPSGPTVMVTLAGFATPDLSNGKLSVSFGTDQASQSNYMYIRAN